MRPVALLFMALVIYCAIGFVLGGIMGAVIRTLGWWVLRARTSLRGYKVALVAGPILSIFILGVMVLNCHGLVTYSHDVFTIRVLAANLVYGLLFIVIAAGACYAFRHASIEALPRGGGAPAWVALATVLLGISIFGGLYLKKEGWPTIALPDDPTGRPNVLWIVMDTVRADGLSCYGNERETTPVLDQLAREGALFEQGFATAPWTLPSHASMFTGTFPSKHGLTGAVAATEHLALRKTREKLIAEIFQAQGYATVGFAENPWLSSGSGLDKGFTDFFDIWEVEVDKLTFLERALLRAQSKGMIPYSFTNYTIASVKRWLRHADPQKPFFMFINFMDAHSPYTPAEPFKSRYLNGRSVSPEVVQASNDTLMYVAREVDLTQEDMEVLVALYEAEISYLDSKLSELLELLRKGNVLDRTVVVVASDHGENFGWQHLMTHVFALNDELLRVPLIFRYPPLIPAGKRIGDFVQLVDIFPTLLDLVGFDFDGKEQLQGLSLLPMMTDDARSYPERRAVFAENDADVALLESAKIKYVSFNWDVYERPLRAVREENLKYVWAGDGKHALYDFSVDEKEEENLIDIKTDEAKALAVALENWLASFEHAPPPSQEEMQVIDPELREKLRSLGYIQ